MGTIQSGRRRSRDAYAPTYPAYRLGWVLIIALIADNPFHRYFRIIVRYVKMSDFAPVAEDPHVREAESAECGIREHAEKVEPLLEQKVIIIGAGQYLEISNLKHQV